MRFYYHDYLALYLAIPVIAILLFALARYRRKITGKLGDLNTVKRLLMSVNNRSAAAAGILWFAGVVFVIGALARPQYPGGVEKVEVTGGKIVVALDVSLSMLAPDFQPTRLDKAKRQIIDLLDKLKAQTVGLVIFAGEAFVQCPPTSDYSAFRMFLDVAEVGMISDTGTDLADAINKAAELLDDTSPVDKAVIVFTDGETFEGNAKNAASEAYKKGIKVYTVGVGSTSGRPLPDDSSGGGLKKNRDGEIIISRLNEDELTDVAADGGGKFYRSTPGNTELDNIFADVKGLQGEEKETRFKVLYAEKYKWLLLPGIALLSLACFIPQDRRKLHA